MVLWAHGEHVSYDLDDAGSGVRIGVVDTLLETDIEGIEVVEQECCLRPDPDEARTGDHGKSVTNIAGWYAPEGEFCLYQAADRPPESAERANRLHQMAFARAVEAAIEHDVALLNVSAGRYEPECVDGHCIFCEQATRAVAQGVSVVAAAGNNPEAGIHCPSRAQDAISVSGVEFRCTAPLRRTPNVRSARPELAYWTQLWSEEQYPTLVASDTYCTTRGCWRDESTCAENMEVAPWDRNPVPDSHNPTVLSPLHYVGKKNERAPYIWAASSFATPVVTGCLAGILSVLEGSPAPYTIQNAVRNAANETLDGEAGIFDARATLEELEREVGA